METKTNIFFSKGSAWAIILITALTFMVYAYSLKNSFTGDDFSVIVDNDFAKSWKNFPAIFSKAYLDTASEKEYLGSPVSGSGEKLYRPVVTVTYFIDYSLWGLAPFGYHLTNLFLHIFNVILLYLLVSLIAKNREVALVASLIFALHPVNSEAVNAIAFREDLLVFFFFVSSFILFIKSYHYSRHRKGYCLTVSAVLFLLALFSKEMAIALPLLLVLYDHYFHLSREPKKPFCCFRPRYLGYAVAGLFYLWVRFLVMFNADESFIDYPGGSLYINLLTMSKTFGTYLLWLFFPDSIHTTLRDTSYFAYSRFKPEVFLPILMIIACLVFAAALYKRAKAASFAILWFFVTLIPVSNIVPISTVVACRYLYIPAVGFCLLMAILLQRFSALRVSFIRPDILSVTARGIVVCLVIFYSTFTIIRGFTWRNDTTLWTELVRYHPKSALAHRGLGDSFRENGLFLKAISEYRKAIELEPGFALSYNSLGTCFYEKGWLNEALYEFNKALMLNPKWPDGYVNIGIVMAEMGRHKEAIDYLKEAIRLNPDHAQAYNNLGAAYIYIEDWDKAESALEKALEIDPGYKAAQANLLSLKKWLR